MSSLTAEQVMALAPDTSSAKAAGALSVPARWSGLGGNSRAAWGECQGSGKTPYQTQVDLSDLTARCSCPSRKFPCKHALGLLLLRSHDSSAFQDATPPAWVVEWLESRASRQQARAEKTARQDGDPSAKARRQEARDEKIRAGLEELGLWLRDLVRSGFVSLGTQPYRFWELMAARLVDAQAPGAARLVRELATVPASGEGWPERLLERLGRLHLLVEGYRRLETLPPDLQCELRSALGWNPDAASVLSGPAHSGPWAVVGQISEQEERLTVRRTWLSGPQGQEALILDFAHASTPLAPALPVGTVQDAELCFYPATLPLRALVRQQGSQRPWRGPPGHPDIPSALRRFAGALARNPWLERFPLTLQRVHVWPPGGRTAVWQVQDESGHSLSLPASFQGGWSLLAFSGGESVSLCGEWDGQTLSPLAVGNAQGWHALTTLGFSVDLPQETEAAGVSA
ncbi:SWIM zinc finger family protein [Deinococcus peraridilitoris]|uniref:SWIM-type domain-containing protein n=1 Tax=Deinococcus peraridilitoris (strain DSM 19664 / LMG 22246 / CIP 109416 / KR-200) TaxID=937777 RepID=L0A1L4_DEIPD|nr:SWIM zinc finger family protein [Deinococcus peraridilitoris]AFZ67721.1 hypothetical protein Deipe_2237 [Deinococcus peraridilitoris DSM 19664]